MKTNHILIDYENVQVKSLALLKGEHFRVYVFLGSQNSKVGADLAMQMQELGARAQYIKLDVSSRNALDFHITYYLGKLSAAEPSGCFCIISKDKGFDSLVKHINEKGVECVRVVSIETLPCLASVVAKKPAPKAAKAVKPSVASKHKAEELVALVISNLVKQQTAKPRTEKTLRSTVKNWCGKQYSEKEVETVFNRLVKKGIVTVDGAKVIYELPNNFPAYTPPVEITSL